MGSQWNPYPLGRRDVPPDTVTKKVSDTGRAAGVAAGVVFSQPGGGRVNRDRFGKLLCWQPRLKP